MPKHVVIVGAGPAGLTAAEELVSKGIKVTVLEKDPTYVGGLSRTVQFKHFRFDIGGHRFFSKNAEIVKWWQDRLPHDFLNVKRQSRIYYKGKLYDYPLRPFNALRNLGLFNSIACAQSYAWIKLFPINPEVSFEDWVTNRFGRRLFKIFFKTYTEKVWGIPCSRISSDWASQRIRGLSLKEAVLNAFKRQDKSGRTVKTLINEFFYPRLGPGMMWETTRRDIEKQGGRIFMGKTAARLVRKGHRVVEIQTEDKNGHIEKWSADEYIVTMPLRETILAFQPPLPEHIRDIASRLSYRDFITVMLVIKERHLFGDNWIYVHDPTVMVGRVQNFKNWSPEMVPVDGVSCLGCEYFCNIDDFLWQKTDAELLALASHELEEIGLIPDSKIIDGCVVRMEKAYPVYDHDYKNNIYDIRKAISKIENLQTVGRNGMHKYNNQDHSMMTALLAARNLIGENHDPWHVNSDAEYQETESPVSRL